VTARINLLSAALRLHSYRLPVVGPWILPSDGLCARWVGRNGTPPSPPRDLRNLAYGQADQSTTKPPAPALSVP